MTDRLDGTHNGGDMRAMCKRKDCGRPAHSGGLCRPHVARATGAIKGPVRGYRERVEGRVLFGGIRVSQRAAVELKRAAQEKGYSPAGLVANVLEEWCGKVGLL